MSSLEETQSVEELDAGQLGEFVFLVIGAEKTVDGDCGEEGSHEKGSRNELVAFAGDKMEDGRAESRHGVGDGKTERGPAG